jgi:hypothetical protein
MGNILHKKWMSMIKTTRNFTVTWVVGIPLAIINATIRNYLVLPYTGELLAHQISSITMIIIFAAYFWALNRKWSMASQQQALTIGGIWLGLTIVFEFLFGHYIMGNTWTRLLADYNILAGRLWSLVLLWTFIGPYVIYRSAEQ